MTDTTDPARTRRPFAVLGATGGQGGAVVDALLDAGHPVRAVVRSTGSGRARALAERGVELAVADMISGAGLAAAFADVDGAFTFTTPFESENGTGAELEQGAAIISAATHANLPHMVFSSVASADRGTGVPHFESKYAIEQQLVGSGLAHTIVGPTYFYDNIFGGGDAMKAGLLIMGMPADRPLQQLSRRDLGRFVAGVLTDPARFAGQRIDIASDAVTPDEMATIVSDVTGRPTRAESFDPERISSPDMRAMFTFLSRDGYSVDIPALHTDYPEVGWESFADWAATSMRD